MKNNKSRINKKIDINAIIAIAISIIILVFCILFLCTNTVKYSDKEVFEPNENRTLAKLEAPSILTLQDGSYFDNLQAWFCDYFPLRYSFMNLKYLSERALLKTEIDNVYLGKNKFYINEPDIPTFNDEERIISVFDKLKDNLNNANLKLMLIPTSVTVYSNKLPIFAYEGSQLSTIRDIYNYGHCQGIDVASALLREADNYRGITDGDNLYYMTDHHWTSLGAYFAYQEFCRSNNMSYIDISRLQRNIVSKSFKGTIYSKVGNYMRKGEDMWIYNGLDNGLTVYYPDTKETTHSLYNPKYLNERDKYSYFLNNLHPLVEITNNIVNNNDELVVVKDSYANCLVPFLTRHYKKIYVIDPRYFRTGISKFVNEHKNVRQVLAVYNMGTIMKDIGIGGIY